MPLRETLYRKAFNLSGNRCDAEDLVQETMLKAYAAFDSFQPQTNLRAWLVRILTNSYITGYRKAMRRPRLYSTDGLADQHWAAYNERRPSRGLNSTEEQWLDSLLDRDIEAAIRALPERFCEVVYYRDVEGLPYKDIAVLTNTPCGTVTSRVHRGRQKLRSLLADATGDHPGSQGPTAGLGIDEHCPSPKANWW
jgi:RNA polymerase sigma-70 factor (ECF subfamily)